MRNTQYKNSLLDCLLPSDTNSHATKVDNQKQEQKNKTVKNKTNKTPSISQYLAALQPVQQKIKETKPLEQIKPPETKPKKQPSPKSTQQYTKIGKVAQIFDVKTSVLRFWESEFEQLTPYRTDKGQRLYSSTDIALIKKIKSLLHDKGMTIEGVKKVLEKQKQFTPPSPLPILKSKIQPITLSEAQENTFKTEQVFFQDLVQELENIKKILQN